MTLFRRYLCPYCMDELRNKDVQECCDIDASHIVNGRVSRDRSCKEAGCNGHYTRLRCGKCKHILPNGFNQFDGYIRFAMVAPSQAGKSCFITIMLQELITSGMRFTCVPVEGTRGIHEANRKSLYDDHMGLPPTNPGTVTPQQWQIRDTARIHGSTVPTYSMTIFDGAGEDLSKDRLDPIICRYIAQSKLIFLLVDPTQIDGVRKRMSEDNIRRAHGSETGNKGVDIINPLVDYIRGMTHTRINALVDTPVAVIFGKMDTVAEKFGRATVLQPSRHVEKRKFILSEANMVHEEIKTWLEMQGESTLTALLDANFKTWRYFGVSPFGTMPDVASLKLGDIRPVRVLDPLMWALSLENIIPVEN